jgi:hypothetical protein
MATRSLRILKVEVPMIGICEACNTQFTSNLKEMDEAKRAIEQEFDTHNCKRFASSQNAHRIVREATKDK